MCQNSDTSSFVFTTSRVIMASRVFMAWQGNRIWKKQKFGRLYNGRCRTNQGLEMFKIHIVQ